MNIFILGCNGNLGKSITDYLANSFNANVYGIDLHSSYSGQNENVKYLNFDFLKLGFNNELKKILNKSNNSNCFINLIAKDYPVTDKESDINLSKNSPFELSLEEITDSFKTTLGSSYILIQEVMKFNKKNNHLILLGSIYSRHLPDPFNYSIKGDTYKPVAYSLSKAAQNMLFKEACRTISNNKLRINMITLGGVYTNQNFKFVERYSSKVPIKKMVTLNDIENCLDWIIFKSPKAINGCELIVDGGWSLAN
tara:strand:+ start:63 stop:821 length:759 start_codon:yes stop_codon:yes gene_type:complete